MKPETCGKVIHLTYKSAHGHAKELAHRYGREANEYICELCTDSLGRTIWHVGYGYDVDKLSKRARRDRKQAGSGRGGYAGKRVNGRSGGVNRKRYDRRDYDKEALMAEWETRHTQDMVP